MPCSTIPDFAGKISSQLKVTVAGGMALQKAVAERWEQVTGAASVKVMAWQSLPPVLTVNILGKAARLGYIGLPVSSTDIKIVDDNGVEVPPWQPQNSLPKAANHERILQ